MIQKNQHQVTRIDQPSRYKINYILHIRSIFEKTRLLRASREKKTCIHVEIGNVACVQLLKANTIIRPSLAGHKESISS